VSNSADITASGGEQSRVQQWTEALTHRQHAIRILDQSDAPPHVGAEIDLAINRLRDVISTEPKDRA